MPSASERPRGGEEGPPCKLVRVTDELGGSLPPSVADAAGRGRALAGNPAEALRLTTPDVNEPASSSE